MTAYNPDPFVTVDGVTWTGKALEGVSINVGRSNVDEQPRAGYASVTIITKDTEAAPTFVLDDDIEIGVVDSTNAPKTLFKGRVSDIERTINNYGSLGYLIETRVTGIGLLALLARRSVGGNGYPEELDGIRIGKIIDEATGLIWSEYGTDTWNDVSASLTWAGISGGFVGTIDEGDYPIIAYTGDPSDAYNLAVEVANSARGVIYEKADGTLNYSDVNSRVTNATFVDLPADVILSTNITSSQRISDLINDMSVGYGNNLSTTGQNATSITNYGRLSASINTLLADINSADTVKNYYLDTRSEPRSNLSQISVALHLDNMTDNLRDALLNLSVGAGVLTTALPAAIYPGLFTGYVEGWSWQITRNTLFLTLNVSEYSLSRIAQAYNQIDQAVTYNTIDAALEWQEAVVI